MAHLYIHGIPIECSASDWEPVELGEITRSLNGVPRSTKRAKKRDHRFTTDQGGLLLDEAEALRALIIGDGHSWSFDATVSNGGLTSSRSLLASSTSGTVETGVTAGPFGFCLTWTAGSSASWSLGAEYVSAWTIVYWYNGGGGWNHLIVRSADAGENGAYVNGGYSSGGNPGIVAITSGTVTAGTAFGTDKIDELVVLPFSVPDEWPSSMHAFHNANTWGALPMVKASGPGVPSAGLTAMGEAYTGRRVPMRESNGGFTSGEVFDFKLFGT